MGRVDYSEVLGGWQGYQLGLVQRRRVAGEPDAVWIELVPVQGAAMRCSGCGRESSSVHDVDERAIRDLPILDMQTVLVVHRRRVACATCGPKLEQVEWLAPYSRVTKRLAECVARLCEVMPIRHVASHFGLGWETVKTIHKRWLAQRVAARPMVYPEAIIIDEFALHKGRQYATVIMDPQEKRVLWVGEGRSREAIRPFFESLGAQGRARLKAVGTDMNGAYVAEIQAQCPHAAIVYDLFHVIQKYNKEVIRRVRVDEMRRWAKKHPTRELLRRGNWLVQRTHKNIASRKERQTLKAILDANKALFKVYVLGQDLRQLWSYRRKSAAQRFWRAWYRRAMYSRIPSLKNFARRIAQYIDGILAHTTWPLHTSLLEGVNNKIKVIKRMAYGFRDHQYFFLRILNAFPGIP